MKVMIVNSYYDRGGAARAAKRLATALRRVDVDVVYRQVHSTREGFVDRVRWLVRLVLDRGPGVLAARGRVMFSSGRPHNPRLVREINASDADVVHLHWVNAGALSIEDVAAIKKPVVWSLHDMWPFTGGCHYDGGCGRYTSGCGRCPALGSSKADDMSADLSRKKREVYARSNIAAIVGLSRWIASCAEMAEATRPLQVINLPNPIDTNEFSPVDRLKARKALNLDVAGHLIVFGAVSAYKDGRKGYSYLLKALSSLRGAHTVELAVFGGDNSVGLDGMGFTLNCLGKISDNRRLRLLFSAADVVVVPSLQENLSNVIMEALACGAPVVAFDLGGNSDLVDHKRNGYLAIPRDSGDLADGINWVLEHPTPELVRSAARGKVLSAFSEEVVAKEYLRLYRDCMTFGA